MGNMFTTTMDLITCLYLLIFTTTSQGQPPSEATVVPDTSAKRDRKDFVSFSMKEDIKKSRVDPWQQPVIMPTFSAGTYDRKRRINKRKGLTNPQPMYQAPPTDPKHGQAAAEFDPECIQGRYCMCHQCNNCDGTLMCRCLKCTPWDDSNCDGCDGSHPCQCDDCAGRQELECPGFLSAEDFFWKDMMRPRQRVYALEWIGKAAKRLFDNKRLVMSGREKRGILVETFFEASE